MDGIQILIYIVIAIVYLVVRGINQAKKKMASGDTPGTGDNPPNESRPPGPFTLEDLLEEIGRVGKKPQSEEATRKAEEAGKKVREYAERKYQAGKREIAAKSRQLEKSIRQERKRLVVEEDDEAQSLENATPAYENEANLVDYEVTEKAGYAGLDDHRKRFTPFELTTNRTNAYAQLLRNPQSARQAFILSEIFQRKY